MGFFFLPTGMPPISLVARIGNDFDLALSGFVTCVWAKGTIDTNIELSLRVEHRDSESSNNPESTGMSISAPCSTEDSGRAVEFAGLAIPAFREPGFVFRIYTNGQLVGPGGKRSVFSSVHSNWQKVYELPFEYSSESNLPKSLSLLKENLGLFVDFEFLTEIGPRHGGMGHRLIDSRWFDKNPPRESGWKRRSKKMPTYR